MAAAPPSELSLHFSKELLYRIASDSRNRVFNEIRSEFLAENKGFPHFDLERHGDDITLTFGWRDGPDRIQFTWMGNKHDFYRASMGVRLGETLESLCRADPNLEAGGAKIDGESITFRVTLAGAPPAKNPPEPQARPAPVPAEAHKASVSPPGAGREVAGSTPDTPRVETGVVESAARPPPAPSAAPTTGVTSAEAWAAARREGTLQAFSRFLQAHPDAPHAPEAQRRADALREDKAYQRALKADEPQVYRAFLEQFSASPHRAEVKTRLGAVEESRRQAEVERRTREALAGQRRTAYAEARRLDTPEAYRMFLTTYPESPEAPEFRRRTEQIEADDRAFREAGDTLEGLEAYLATHPKGRHATEARSHAQRRRRERAERDFAAARRAGTVEAMEAFLEAWPDGPRAREARDARTRLAASRPQARGATPGGKVVLEARAGSTTPTLDGDPGDAVWREAPPALVAVHSDNRTFDLKVRASHTETDIFLLVQWQDDTGDTRYRPWKWSAEDDTYRQVSDLDDALAVALYPPGGDPEACMLAGRPVGADVWMWRAQWSDLSGLALDGRMQVSRSRLPRSNPYPARDGSGQLWLRQPPDAGTNGWSFFIPVEYQGDVVDSYRPSRASGSRADVRARGSWAQGVWTVEFARALDTRHEDDVRMGPGGAWSIAFAVYDRAEKQHHASSDLVHLRLGGK